MAKQPPKGRGSKSKSAKTPETETTSRTQVDDAQTPEAEVVAGPEGDSLVMTDPQLAEAGEPEVDDADIRSAAEEADPAAADEPAEEAEQEPVEEIAPEPVNEESRPAPEPRETTRVEPTTAPAQSGGSVFLPMLLGGLVAGGIGYGVAYLQYVDQGPAETIDPNRIAALEERLDALPDQAPATDLSGVEGSISALQADVAGLSEDLAALDERVGVVERQPSADGTLQDTAIAAFEQDMEDLRAQIAGQQESLQAMADQASQQIEATRAEALDIEATALEAARAATARAALAKVQGALDSGAPLGAALTELEETIDQPVPDALQAVAEGAPTLAELRADFPAAARQALSTARAEGVSGEGGSAFTSFLRDQFDVRSVEPQDGDSADAILSRAEAALNDGRLNDALAEVATLPEVARADLSDWTARAETRAAAIDAAETLAVELNAN